MRCLASLSVVTLLLVAGCDGPARVTFDDEHCSLDGRPATVDQVEAEQSRLAHRVLSRQPIQTGITLLVLLIAGGTYIDKLARLFSRRRRQQPSERGPTLTGRMRAFLDRHSAHPVRYFAIVATTVTVILVGGGVYIYLDADKRASERALQQLQFCHLALKTAEEKDALDAQRRNLDQLSSTAGDIKQLVDQLPPEEQRKAQQLLAQMRVALGNQRQMFVQQTQMAEQVQAGSALIQKNLGALAADVVNLKPLPARLKDLGDALARIEARTRLSEKPADKGPATMGDEFAALHKELGAVGDRVNQLGQTDCTRAKLPSGKTVGEALAELSSRPAVCKCECGGAPSSSGRDAGAR